MRINFKTYVFDFLKNDLAVYADRFFEYNRVACYALYMKDVRARALIYHEGKLLMIHTFRKGIESYVLPGGHVEEGEQPEVTVVREVAEETSLDVTLVKEIQTLVDKKGVIHHVYLCEYISGEPKLHAESPELSEEGNTYEPLWVDINSLKDLPIWPAEIAPVLIEYFNL